MTRPWRLTPGQTLLQHHWDGQVVLYNDVSGATHLLDQATYDLLCDLRDDLLDANDWADPSLQHTLAELQRLYLVQPC